jgi:TolB protein
LNARLAAISPDGRKIAYTIVGSGETRFTQTDGSHGSWQPQWSLDGSKIVFTSNRDGANWEIYAMNADGSNQTRITSSTGEDSHPDWTR